MAISRYAVFVLNDDGTVDVIETDWMTPEGEPIDPVFEIPDKDDVEEWEDIIKISVTDFDFTCLVGLKSDGTVVASGYDNQYNVEDWEDIKDICCGDGVVYGLKKDGTVVSTNDSLDEIKSWKDIKSIDSRSNFVGLKDDGTVNTLMGDAPAAEGRTSAIKRWNDIVQISDGFFCTAGLKSDGTVVAAGYNKDGRCDVDDWRNVTKVVCTKESTMGFTCAATFGLKEDGTVYATGGIHPDVLKDIEEWEDIVDIACGYDLVVGLKSDGTVVAVSWDEWRRGGLIYSDSFVMSDRTDFCDYRDWKDIEEIYVKGYYIVGVKADGTLISNYSPLNEELDGYKIKDYKVD